ncbi:probable cytochrome P450 6a14 [Ischnura elegans]|uniref:probable cytochrome P450 6a14 n=1 Tax=Ischnura elegans TaxID=197161 RepID=UPI001ED887F5|nr:probable cytochrome P450 6a14 [Ischnura elegans]
MIFIDSFGVTEVVILLITILCGLFYWAFIAPLNYWGRKGVPNIPGTLIFGNLWDAITLKGAIGEIYADLYFKLKGKRYGGFVKFHKPGIIVRDPELIKNVLLRDFTHFHDNDVQMHPKLDPLMARNIFVVPGENWKKIRSGVTPAFTAQKIKTIFPLITENCDRLKVYFREMIEKSGEKGWEIEMKDMAARFMTENVSSCAFGLQTDAIRNPDNEFRQMGKQLLEPTPMKALVQLIIMVQPTLSRILRLKFFSTDITDFFRRLVKDVLSKREETGTTRNDFLQMLTQLCKQGKLGLIEEEKEKQSEGGDILSGTKLDDIAAQAVGFFTDGFETSSSLFGFTIFEMAHNPDMQQRLREEVFSAMERHGGHLTYEGIQEMEYMEMVVQETLRLYPPVLSFTRICTKRYQLPPHDEGDDSEKGGVWIEEGMPVVIPVYGLHRDPIHYPDPEVFDPERFTEEGKKERHRFVHLPIGEGPRICIGIRFGLAQTKSAIATVLANYEVLPSERTNKPIKIDPNNFLFTSKDKLWVRFRHLKQ